MEQNIDERSSVPKAEQAKGVAQPLHSPMIQRWVVPEPGRSTLPLGIPFALLSAKPFSTRREALWKQRRPKVPVAQKTGLDHDSRDPQFDLPPVRQDFYLRREGRRSLSNLAAWPLALSVWSRDQP
jgi:hypothetical protein